MAGGDTDPCSHSGKQRLPSKTKTKTQHTATTGRSRGSLDAYPRESQTYAHRDLHREPHGASSTEVETPRRPP